MKLKDYTSAQERAWDEIAPVHKGSQFETLLSNFKQPGYSCLDAVETDIWQKLNIRGKSVIQLACNNGREILSVKNLGAGRCVGIDISGEFIKQGRELAQAGHIECELERMDVYDIPESYNQQFDMVYITIGAMCWMPDLNKFFDVIVRLLKTGGHLFIYDTHPILGMYSAQDTRDVPEPDLSYFLAEPFLDQETCDYYTHKPQEKASPRWWFQHKLSDVFEAGLTHNMAVVSFKEYPHDVGVFSAWENKKIQFPLSYSLILRKD